MGGLKFLGLAGKGPDWRPDPRGVPVQRLFGRHKMAALSQYVEFYILKQPTGFPKMTISAKIVIPDPDPPVEVPG